MHERRSRHGFTLLEMLLVMVIVAMVGSAFVVSSTLLFSTPVIQGMENLVITAQQTSRLRAIEDGEVYRLIWDEKGRRFALVGAQLVEDFALDDEAGEERIQVSFEQPAPQEAGQSVSAVIWREVESMTLYPDGTAAPTRVQLKVEGLESTIEFEAFSGLVWEGAGA